MPCSKSPSLQFRANAGAMPNAFVTLKPGRTADPGELEPFARATRRVQSAEGLRVRPVTENIDPQNSEVRLTGPRVDRKSQTR